MCSTGFKMESMLEKLSLARSAVERAKDFTDTPCTRLSNSALSDLQANSLHWTSLHSGTLTVHSRWKTAYFFIHSSQNFIAKSFHLRYQRWESLLQPHRYKLRYFAPAMAALSTHAALCPRSQRPHSHNIKLFPASSHPKLNIWFVVNLWVF